jgi:hypothetical protein
MLAQRPDRGTADRCRPYDPIGQAARATGQDPGLRCENRSDPEYLWAAIARKRTRCQRKQRAGAKPRHQLHIEERRCPGSTGCLVRVLAGRGLGLRPVQAGDVGPCAGSKLLHAHPSFLVVASGKLGRSDPSRASPDRRIPPRQSATGSAPSAQVPARGAGPPERHSKRLNELVDSRLSRDETLCIHSASGVQATTASALTQRSRNPASPSWPR